MLLCSNHIYVLLIAVFFFSVISMVVYNRIIYFRERKITKKVQRLNKQLTLIMDANKTNTWTYKPKRNMYRVISKQNLTETFYTPLDFSQFYDRDDFKRIQKAITSLLNRDTLSDTLTVKGAPTQDGSVKYYEITLSVLHRDRHDMPSEILGTQRNITLEQQRAENTRKLMLRYHTVFNSSLVDMIYYNADGYLADMNDKACETFGVKDLQALLNRQMKMTDIPSYREMDIRSIEHTQLSSITDINQTKATDERVPEVTRQGKIYYEVMLGPIRNESNQLYGVIAAGRDITEMVESTHKQKEAARLIKKRNNEIQQYISDINYSLKISEARLVNYYPDTHELEILSDLSETGKRIPQLHAVALIHSDDRHKAQHLILHMDRRRLGTISETLHTKLLDKQGRDIYLNFNLMPITNSDGLVTHYFGLLRNDTEMSYTEMRLQEETAKAQEEEQLKNAFLLNMSYELRVPLHAVLGFAELFKTEHNQEDEPIFANEIKKNTDVLLNLINDILFISRLDAHMIEYNYEVHDFATLFDTWCLHGWGETNNKTKKIINNTYESLRVKIDKHNLGIAIEKLCNFIGLSTNEGLIKSRYEYLHDELIVIVDSTDGGMDLEDATKMFDRFVSDGKNKRVGTGLDLPIVKEMIEQMGGTIDVLSEPNKGSSFFIALPCEMIDFERKIER